MARKPTRLVRDLLLLLLLISLVLWPNEVVTAGQDGLTLCARVIIPALFPFFVLSSMMISTGLAQSLGTKLERVVTPLFRLGGNCAGAIVLGLVGGYPVGAKTTAELYQRGLCSKEEGEHLLIFCNNCGPAFFLGVVGSGIFHSAEIGGLLWGIHVLSALMIGLLFRRYPNKRPQQSIIMSINQETEFIPGFLDSVKQSFFSMLNLCAFILFFGVLIALLDCWGLNRLPESASVLNGILELSNGVAGLAALPFSIAFPLSAFFLGWGGVSVLLQSVSVLQGSGLSVKPLVLGKLLHGLLSALLAWLIAPKLDFFIPTAAFAPALTVSWPQNPWCPLLCAIFLFVLLRQLRKNRGGNRRKSRV